MLLNLSPTFERQTVLVTGGCGFIGSHLCDALISDGHRVRVLDDLSTGRLDNLPPEADLIEGCVTRAQVVAHALRGVSACYHLAAIASVDRARSDLFRAHMVNQGGFVAVLDEISRIADRRVPLVYASSAAVYGDGQADPIDEDAPKRPLSSYGVDKYACELQAAAAAQAHGISSVGLRFFNVYGPRQDASSPYSGVISIFSDRARSDRPILIYGDGLQTRDFVAVEDVVLASRAAMRLASTTEGAQTFNVCTGRPTTILELSGLLSDLHDAQPQLAFNPPRIGDIRHSVGSPLRTRRTLGLPDPTPLSVGLRRLVRRPAEPATPEAAAEARGP